MKVLLYSGGRQLVKESGVGRALSHQEQALSYGNVDFTENTKDDYDIVHINTVLPDAWAMAVKPKKKERRWCTTGIPPEKISEILLSVPTHLPPCLADGCAAVMERRIWC